MTQIQNQTLLLIFLFFIVFTLLNIFILFYNILSFLFMILFYSNGTKQVLSFYLF